MALADDLINVAQKTNQTVGQSGNDALQAYHIAATAEHARQELEMEKQKQEQNKSDWFHNNLAAIAKMPPEMQKIAQSSFSEQAKKLYPNMHDDIGEAMSKDHDFVQNLARTFASKHGQDISVADAVGSDLSTLQTHMEKTLQQESAERAANIKNASFAARGGAAQDQATRGWLDSIHKDPAVTNGVQLGNRIDKGIAVLQNKPTWQQYEDALQDYANGISGMKGSSDSKLAALRPTLSGPQYGKFSTYLTNNPGAAGNRASDEAVKWLTDNFKTLSDVNDRQIGGAANRHLQGVAGHLKNTDTVEAMRDLAKTYQGGGWRAVHPEAGGNEAAPAGPAEAKPEAPAAAGGQPLSFEDFVKNMRGSNAPGK